ncbi:MAG: PfaD family polyunsaturated fatty acid/polyketide biosynthesis protein [Gammaproteobacteria bacterium]|nr:PfaD family polyunsaturated fatty acid/polyketide biosynthesis protein [Gammaproteobacteria bacterium]
MSAESLGSSLFRQDYQLRYAYVSGAMVKGIASCELVIAMSKAGFLAFYGTGGQKHDVIEQSIINIQNSLGRNQTFGMNLLCDLAQPEMEMKNIDLFLEYGVRNIEASAYMQITPALVKFRLSGLVSDNSPTVVAKNRILAKVSRPEVARQFLNPAPEEIVQALLDGNHISEEEAAQSRYIPIASDICVESDSAGHTDMGVSSILLPSIISLRDQLQTDLSPRLKTRVGAGGGIGTPESAASTFMLGADFITTGSINQCSVEAGTSDVVKEMLSEIDVQDTEYAPAGDMFELGAKIQVMKKKVFFPARANRLYDLWKHHEGLHSLDLKTQRQIQDKFFGRSFNEVYDETRKYYLQSFPDEIEKAEKNPRAKMALVFRWYFIHTMRLALKGDETRKVSFQVHSGPAMGAFNQWVAGTELGNWENRHVDQIAEKIMYDTASLLQKRFQLFTSE